MLVITIINYFIVSIISHFMKVASDQMNSYVWKLLLWTQCQIPLQTFCLSFMTHIRTW